MRFPILICRRNTLAVGAEGFFKGIADVDETAGLLDMNVSSDGRASLHWILDSDGMLFRLTSQGLLPPSFLQRIGLHRRRERYRIDPPRRARVGEVAGLIANLEDEFSEAPNVTDLRLYLNNLPEDSELTREALRDYFGE